MSAAIPVLLVIGSFGLGLWRGAISSQNWRRLVKALGLILLGNLLVFGTSHMSSLEVSVALIGIWLYIILPATVGFCIGAGLGLIGRWLTRKDHIE
ncbi:hypothetical protein [Shimia sp.]|uniref:hypothetical protein n=1 Tax=Shimia sp. TaxID=1954381 RepID=UPI003299C4B4